MKRSEMLKKIHDYLDQDLNMDMEPEWIEEILNIVEKNGMLPPSYKKQLSHKEISLACDYLAKSEGVKIVNDWEPEDG
jgi:hypothetical protein